MRKVLMLAMLILSILTWGCTKAKKIIPPEPSPPEAKITPVATPLPPPIPTPSQKPEVKYIPTPVAKPQAVKSSPDLRDYSVRVDVSEQKVYVYKGEQAVRTMVCSTGIEKEETKTPRGRFIIDRSGDKRGDWFFSRSFGEGAMYWVGFIGGEFLFHSVPMDKNKNIIQSEAEKLGTPASHGCIRLGIDDAYWFYSTIPRGTPLIIQD